MFRTPKTARSRRSIALSDESVRVLRAHRKEQVERPLLLGEGYADDDLVFAAVDGNPLPPYRASQAFRGLVQRIKLGQFRFHDLRHTAAVSAPTLNLPRRRALGLFVANIVVVAPPVPTPALTPVVMPVPAPVGVPPVPAPVSPMLVPVTLGATPPTAAPIPPGPAPMGSGGLARERRSGPPSVSIVLLLMGVAAVVVTARSLVVSRGNR